MKYVVDASIGMKWLVDEPESDAARRLREAYDCLYVALAERDNCELVTADDRLVRNLQTQFPFIAPLNSLP